MWGSHLCDQWIKLLRLNHSRKQMTRGDSWYSSRKRRNKYSKSLHHTSTPLASDSQVVHITCKVTQQINFAVTAKTAQDGSSQQIRPTYNRSKVLRPPSLAKLPIRSVPGTLDLPDANIDAELIFFNQFRRHHQEEPSHLNPIMQRTTPHMRIHLKHIPPLVRFSAADG